MVGLIRKCVRRLRVYALRTVAKLLAQPYSATDKAVLVVAPHPDDEIFGAGGLIARKRELGARVDVVFMTDGRASHRECCGTEASVVGDARRRIARAADSLLGINESRLHWLGLDDGSIPGKKDERFGAAVEILRQLIEQLSPSEVFCPHPLDSWADHEATTEITGEALGKLGNGIELYYYLVWAWHNLPCHRFMSFSWKDSYRLDIRSVQPLKQSAIHRYFADHAPCGRPYCGVLPATMLAAHRWRYELFFATSST